MVFEATTTRIKDVILETENLESITLLTEIPKYLQVLRDTHIFANPLALGVVHIQILEILINQVEADQKVDERILHIMELLLISIAGLSLGSILEGRRDTIAHYLSELKSTHSLR